MSKKLRRMGYGDWCLYFRRVIDARGITAAPDAMASAMDRWPSDVWEISNACMQEMKIAGVEGRLAALSAFMPALGELRQAISKIGSRAWTAQ